MRLSSEQKRGLDAWLEKNVHAIRELDLEVSEVVLMASQDLGFQLTQGLICHRIGPNRKIRHMWPGSEGMLKSLSGQTAARSQVMVAMLEKIRSEIGVDPVDGWEEVIAWATSRSSPGAVDATGSSSPPAGARS
jgi:hypothetical protein